MIPVFERAKVFHALGRAATVIGMATCQMSKIFVVSELNPELECQRV
jgi:hypothetical protein